MLRRLWQRLQGLEPFREVGNGFHKGGTLRSPLACPLPIEDSPCAKTRFGAVVSQQFRLRLNGSWKPLLEGHGNPGMEVLPATAQQGAVSGVLYERMLEGVLGVGRSAAPIDKLGSHQLPQSLVQLSRRHRRNGAEQLVREL